MPVSTELRDMLERISGQVPVWLDVMVAMAGVWGVFLWLFGRRIIKPSLAMTGLIVGAVIGALVGRDLGGASKTVIAVIIGGVAGGLIIWATYRVWIALLLATVLAAAAPWAVLAWYGQEGPQIKQAIKEEAKNVAEKGGDALKAQAEAGDEVNASDKAAARKELFDSMVDAVKRLAGDLYDWWANTVPTDIKWLATAGIVSMGLFGLIVGLIMPELGASLVASLNGALLMMAAVIRLGQRYTPSMSDWLPDSPRRLLVAVAVLATVGALLQWTILGRKADKSD